MDEAGVGGRRRPAGARGDGSGCSQRGAGAAAVVEAGQRDVPAVDPRQRGHHLRSRQDAAKGSINLFREHTSFLLLSLPCQECRNLFVM